MVEPSSQMLRASDGDLQYDPLFFLFLDTQAVPSDRPLLLFTIERG